MSANGKQPVLAQAPPAVHRSHAPALTHALARDAFGRDIAPAQDPGAAPATAAPSDPTAPAPKRETATDAIGRRAGALSDEIDFPEFVASLVHGTFDAIVDSAIRQMESFANLVAAVAKPVEQFTQENVSINQARDYLVEQHPKDLMLSRDDDGPRVVPRPMTGEDGKDEPRTPDWLGDYGLPGEELTPELIDQQLVPRAREHVARNRLQTLSTMVLLGMNRVIVKDGTIGARLRFRAAAADHTKVDYATSNDGGQPPDTEWGRRGSRTYDAPRTMVSTVGVNVQSDSELKAELFGDVKINFASETVPLDRFMDEASRNVLERHARRSKQPPAAAAPPAAMPSPFPAPPVASPVPAVPAAAVAPASAIPAAAPGATR